MNAVIPEIKNNWAELPAVKVEFRGSESYEFVHELVDHCEYVAEQAEEELINCLMRDGVVTIGDVTLSAAEILRKFLVDSNYRDKYIAESKKFHPFLQEAYEEDQKRLDFHQF